MGLNQIFKIGRRVKMSEVNKGKKYIDKLYEKSCKYRDRYGYKENTSKK